MYDTILNCPECGFEVRLVADEVVADRDRFRAALEQITKLAPISHYAHSWNFDKRVRQIASNALRGSNPASEPHDGESLVNGCEQALLLLERERFADDSEAKVVRAVLRGALKEAGRETDA